MKKREQRILITALLVMTSGIGCAFLDEIPVSEIASASASISDATDAAADLAPPAQSNALRIISIISNTIATLAMTYLGWRIKVTDNPKE